MVEASRKLITAHQMGIQIQIERVMFALLGFAHFRRWQGFNKNITFSEEDLIRVATPHDNALVIISDIAHFNVKWVLVV